MSVNSNLTIEFQVNSEYQGKQFNYIISFIRIIFVLLFRVGCLLIQLGSIPTENVYIILLQNIVDISVSVICFGFIGYTFAYGADLLNLGIIGWNMYIGSEDVDYDEAERGFCAILVSTGIVTTTISGRAHILGYIFTSVLLSSVILPLQVHWIWHSSGFLYRNSFLGYLVEVKDHGGGLVVHVSAGTASLAAALFLGRRVLRLFDIDESSIGPESTGTTLMGYIFIAIGLIAFSLPTNNFELNRNLGYYYGHTTISNIFAMAGSTFAVIGLSFMFSRKAFHYWIIQKCIQGAIVGLVSISAGIDVFIIPVAFGVATFGGIIFTILTYVINLTFIEDQCNFILIHFVCGMYGVIMTAFLGTRENLGYTIQPITMLMHVLWQFFSILAVFALSFFSMCVLFSLLYICGCLRNRSEKINNKRALNLKRKRNVGIIPRIFVVTRETPYIEPGASGKTPEDNTTFARSQAALSTDPRSVTFIDSHLGGN